jgi:hypothetical protein
MRECRIQSLEVPTMHQLISRRLTAAATIEDVARELGNLTTVNRLQSITTEPTATTVPAFALELTDDDARETVEILLAPIPWRVTDALADRPGRWVRIASE